MLELDRTRLVIYDHGVVDVDINTLVGDDDLAVFEDKDVYVGDVQLVRVVNQKLVLASLRVSTLELLEWVLGVDPE